MIYFKENLSRSSFKSQDLYQMKRFTQRVFIFEFDLKFDLNNKKAQWGNNKKNRTTVCYLHENATTKTNKTKTHTTQNKDARECKKRKRKKRTKE